MVPYRLRRVCVYCASSRQCREEFLHAAHRLGGQLAEAGIEVVYGGGAVGLMGALADGALAGGGTVHGIIPQFMRAMEWGHDRITRLEVVDDMHTRKLKMASSSDGLVALPGGCGTLEELLEAITWKRLGLIAAPIVIANLGGFYDALLAQLAHCIDERTMDPRHAAMWQVAATVDDVLPLLRSAPTWDGDEARGFAAI